MIDIPDGIDPIDATEPQKPSPCHTAALLLLRSGISVLPIRPNSKAPALSSWTPLQTARATEEDVRHWWGGGTVGLAVIGGTVSGYLLVLDFDRAGLLADFRSACQDNDVPWPTGAAIVETPSGGNHVYLRCDSPVPGNLKIARDAEGKTILETRGEGGYALTFPTPGYCRVEGRLDRLPVVTAEHLGALLAIGGLLNEYTPPAVECDGPDARTAAPRPEGSSLSPGEDYDQRGDWAEVLIRHGWRRLHRRGEATSWTRPGKAEHECSATSGHRGANGLYVFSTNAAPFAHDRIYRPFGIYALLEHNGDFREAARELGKLGYGDQGPVQSKRLRSSSSKRSATKRPSGIETDSSTAPDGEPDATAEPDGDMQSFELATIWAKENEGRFLWVEGDQWWTYRENHWRYSSVATVKKSVQQFLERTGKITPTRVRDMMFMVDSMLGPVEIAEFDSHPTWIGLANGVYDLESGELLPHDPLHKITQIVPYEFNREAVCPKWLECLSQWMLKQDGTTSQEWIDVLQEWFGYCLINDVTAQVSMLWIGEGANGKGAATRVLENLVGRENTIPIPIEQLCQEYTRAQIFGKRVGFVNEPDPRSMKLGGTWFKAIVGGDSIAARRPNEKPFSFIPMCRITISTNEMLTTKDLSNGYWRRVFPIEWRYNVPPDLRDSDLDQKLLLEMPGIFNWALEGLRRYRARRKFVMPEESRAILEGYRTSQDSFGRFMKEECDFSDPFAITTSRELYRQYRSWCEEYGIKPDTETAVGLRLTKRGCKNVRPYVDSKRTRSWEGVALQAPAEEDQEAFPGGTG